MTCRVMAALAALLCGAALAAAQPAPRGPDPDPLAPPAGPAAPAHTGLGAPYDWGLTPWAGRSCAGGGLSFDEMRFTASAEYLLWWLQPDRPALPLLSTGGLTGGGSLAAPDTAVLFRLSGLGKDSPYSGGRFVLGFWTGPEERAGAEVNFFFLERKTSNFGAGSDAAGSPLLSVPLFDLNPEVNGPSFSQISVPGALIGRLDASSSTRLWGIEADFKAGLCRSHDLSVDGLLGFRYVDLTERLGLTQTVRGITGTSLLSFEGNAIGANDSLQIADRFDTHNLFYGCDLGLKTSWCATSQLAVDLVTKVALGTETEKLGVAGATTHLSASGAVADTGPGGLFALPGANAGHFSNNRFAVIPEVTVRLRYAPTEWLSAWAGYDFLYWNTVVRPGDQVSGTINSGLAPSQVPFANGGPLAPAPSFRRTDLTVHGLTFGVEVRF